VVGPVQWKEQIANAEWKDVAQMPWIWFPEHCPFHQSAVKSFRQLNIDPQRTTVVDDEKTISSLVSSGLGLSIMIENEARLGEQKKQLSVWSKGRLKIDMSFAFLSRRSQDPIIQALKRGLEQIWELKKS
jgi:DNA-binding transcriptional LysR family regulator